MIHDVAPLTLLSTHFANPHPALALNLHLAELHHRVDLLVELLQLDALAFFCDSYRFLQTLDELAIFVRAFVSWVRLCLFEILFGRPFFTGSICDIISSFV